MRLRSSPLVVALALVGCRQILGLDDRLPETTSSTGGSSSSTSTGGAELTLTLAPRVDLIDQVQTPVTVTIVRPLGLTGPVNITVSNRPNGVTVPDITIDPGANQGTLDFQATGPTSQGIYQAQVTATLVGAPNAPVVPLDIAVRGKDGTLDLSFNKTGVQTLPAAVANAIALDSKDRIVIVGSTAGTTATAFAARFNDDGTADMPFNAKAKLPGVPSMFGYADGIALAIDAQDDVIVAGATRSPPNELVARFTPAGGLDTSFQPSGKYTSLTEGAAFGAVVLPNGDIVVAGASTVSGMSDTCTYATQFSTSITSYDDMLTPCGETTSAVVNFPGSADLLFVGGGATMAGKLGFYVQRYQFGPGPVSYGGAASGKLTFDVGGTGGQARAAAVDGNGGVILAGDNGSYPVLIRLTASGMQDGSIITLPQPGKAYGVALDAPTNGRILVVGASGSTTTTVLLDRLVGGTSDHVFDMAGTLLAGSAVGSPATGKAIVLDKYGRILITGRVDGTVQKAFVARFWP